MKTEILLSQKKLSLDVESIRKDFPILAREFHGKPLVYLDNAATTQKPRSVIDALTKFYAFENANIHRGIYDLSEETTQAFEEGRKKIQNFLKAREAREIIFVRGATEGINLAAYGYGREFVQMGDEIIISGMEHHSNIVPWQILCQELGARLRVIPINDQGELILDEYQKMLNSKTKLVAVTHVSNALGTINPVKTLIELAHQKKIPVLIDGAQAVGHMKVDLQDLDCDFYVFSAHKIYGPTGIGVVYGRAEWLEKMRPYQSGGDMISSVTFEKTEYNVIPYKFEAGTPHIAGVMGLSAALDYMGLIGLDAIRDYEKELLEYGTQKMKGIPGLKVIGTAAAKSGILSFVFDDVHAHDVGTVLDQQGIAVRAGHHCSMPVMDRFLVPATTRASLAFYNTRSEIDALVHALQTVREIFH